MTALQGEADAPIRYTTVAMFLHWAVAIIIVLNVAIALTLDYMPDGWIRAAVDLHKSFGITVIGLVLLHLLWRYANPPPPLPVSYSPWERRIAKAAHIILYTLILAMPISGWLHDSAWNLAAQFPMKLYFLVPWPRIGPIENLDPVTKEKLHTIFGFAHEYLAYVLYGVVALHIAGALKHQFIDRHPQLERMMGWLNRRPTRF
ncbi:MAG: cytochrome b [Xanthobacteraceae bacterium]|nr:cytochrome b [Xanthobacteraceae bacterium]